MRPPKHIREAKAKELKATVTANLELKAKGEIPSSKGYRLSPDPNISHRFSMHPGKEYRTSNSDGVLTRKQKASKYRVSDKEFYDYDKL